MDVFKPFMCHVCLAISHTRSRPKCTSVQTTKTTNKKRNEMNLCARFPRISVLQSSVNTLLSKQSGKIALILAGNKCANISLDVHRAAHHTTTQHIAQQHAKLNRINFLFYFFCSQFCFFYSRSLLFFLSFSCIRLGAHYLNFTQHGETI